MNVAQHINRERVVVLGWGRAILLQLAHPLVAAGVSDHSGFAARRLGRLQRLHATVGAMLDFTSGDPRRVAATAARINAIHDRVNGRLQEAARCYPAGSPYSATDPRLLRWVHATLLDSVPLAYERFVRPLPVLWKDRYCAESAGVARLLRIPDPLLFRDASQLSAYMQGMLAGPEIEVTPPARRVARELLYPPLSDPTRPMAWMVRLVTLGLLPPDIRRGYGFAWTRRHERVLLALTAMTRHLLPFCPRFLRYWHPPHAGSGLDSRGSRKALGVKA